MSQIKHLISIGYNKLISNEKAIPVPSNELVTNAPADRRTLSCYQNN